MNFGFGVTVALLGYIGLLLGLGVFARSQGAQTTLGEFYLAGRNLGGAVLLFTLYATQYSGNTLVGYPGEAYRLGFRTAVVPGTPLSDLEADGRWTALGEIATGDLIAQLGSPSDDPNPYHADPRRISARFFNSIRTGPMLLEELAAEGGPLWPIGTSVADEDKPLVARQTAFQRLTGTLFGPAVPEGFDLLALIFREQWERFQDDGRKGDFILWLADSGAPAELKAQVVAFVQRLREMDLFKLPGIAETIDWHRALLQLDATSLDPQVVNDTLGALLKYQDDIARVQGSEAARLLDEIAAELRQG